MHFLKLLHDLVRRDKTKFSLSDSLYCRSDISQVYTLFKNGGKVSGRESVFTYDNTRNIPQNICVHQKGLGRG